MPDACRAYPSDPSGAEWAILAPLLPPPASSGRPRKWSERQIADAVLYVLRSGCAWRMLPREVPPWPTVYARFRHWLVRGTLRRAHDALRAQVRVAEGREPEASAVVIDSQSAETTSVGGPARGHDGAKRLKGRERHLLVDTTGRVLLAVVHAADLSARDGARRLIGSALLTDLPRLGLVWADQGYTGAFAEWLQDTRGWLLHVVRHPERQLWRYGLEEKPRRAFRVLPRRWVVERTFAWLSQSRRLSRDYQRLPAVSEAMIYSTMSRLMVRRLARTGA